VPVPEETDQLRQSLVDTLRSELGDALLASEAAHDDLWVRVDRPAWRRAAEICRNELGMTYFSFLSGMDWLPNPDLLGEKAWETEEDAAALAAAPSDEDEEEAEGAASAALEEEEEDAAPAEEGGALTTGVAGGDSRFQVFARLYNVTDKVGITLKADLDESDPRVDSLVPVFRGADWHEREAWEMYGFVFDGHPRLRHLYLPQEFEGHPLRKDFPLLARIVKPWPGLVDVEPLPGEAAGVAGAENAGEGG
jgi:NADH-quinone oxidoreductase subunit C